MRATYVGSIRGGNLMKNRCKHYVKSEDRFCVNYIGDKEYISGCKQECKLNRLINQNEKEERLKRRLEAQIIGIEVPYDSK